MNLIKIDLAKYKEIAHEKRRSLRDAELAPLDVQATIPAKAVQAEADREVIRAKYKKIQKAIDSAKTPEEVKSALP